MNKEDTRPYRKGVGIILINTEGLIFVGQRIDTQSSAWQMPQGGLDENENPYEGALRELKEETGISAVSLVGESKHWYDYTFPYDLSLKLWDGQYRGQTQKWFLFQFLGSDQDINIHTLTPEFSEWRWIEPKELCEPEKLWELIISFKKELYEKLMEEFLPVIKTLSSDN